MTTENVWNYTGDLNLEYGGLFWLYDPIMPDCVEAVEVEPDDRCDRVFIKTWGSIYFSPDRWNSALECIGDGERIGPPQLIEVVRAFHAYHGIDPMTFAGTEILQIGEMTEFDSEPMIEPDRIYHGNWKLKNIIRNEHGIDA